MENAFLIGGHGGETNNTFTVPAGCMVIVHGHHASKANRDAHKGIMDELYKLDKEVLHNPLEHIPILLDIYRSIAVYQEGEQCPDFEYLLFDCDSSTECYNIPMGIIDMDKPRPIRPARYNTRTLSNVATKYDIRSHFLQSYRNSVYPTQEEVKEKIEGIIAEDPPSLPRSIHAELSKYRITQSELCEKYKGVYYHNVCRSKQYVTRKLEKMSSSMSSIPELKSHVMRRPSKGTQSHKKARRFAASQSRLSRTLKSRVGETALHRTPYIKQWMNSPAYQSRMRNKVKTEKEDIEKELRKKKALLGPKLKTMQRIDALLASQNEPEARVLHDKERIQGHIDKYTSQIHKLERNINMLKKHQNTLE